MTASLQLDGDGHLSGDSLETIDDKGDLLHVGVKVHSMRLEQPLDFAKEDRQRLSISPKLLNSVVSQRRRRRASSMLLKGSCKRLEHALHSTHSRSSVCHAWLGARGAAR